MRGEHNKKWNKRVTRSCPVCGGRVIVANRNQSWWIRCDDDPFHIKYKPYEDPYSAIRAFNVQNTVCKYCGGTLVEREYRGKTYYYCYSCHLEFERG